MKNSPISIKVEISERNGCWAYRIENSFWKNIQLTCASPVYVTLQTTTSQEIDLLLPDYNLQPTFPGPSGYSGARSELDS